MAKLKSSPGPMSLGPGETYFENDWPHGCKDLADQINLHRLQNLSGEPSPPDDGESASDGSIGNEENPQLEAFLTGTAICSGINLRELSVEDRARLMLQWAYSGSSTLWKF